MNEDSDLLQRYAKEGSNEAFAELVTRHCNLVWSAAYRILGDGDLARDAAQTAFADLARKAGRLPAKVILAGWLHQAASHAARAIARNESRRARREQEAVMLQQISQPNPEEEKAARELQPLLETALAELDETDRNAVVLRFLAGRSLAEVGAALGASEEAARKRVARGLERLRDLFRRRGLEVGGGIVAAALSAAGAQTAPAGLAAALAQGALVGAAALPPTASFSIMANIMKTKIAAGLAATALVGGLGWQYHALTQLRTSNADLEHRLAERSAADIPSAENTAGAEELARLRAEHDELLRLRGEYALLLHKPPSSPEMDQLKSDLAAARQEAARDRAVVDEVKWKENFIRNNNTLKEWGLVLRRVAASQGTMQLSSSFNQLLPLAQLVPGFSTNLAASQNLFEFVDQGRAVSLQEPGLIVMREITPTQSPYGQWMRVYLLADGSTWQQVTPDGNFSTWEQQHMAAPGSVTPPDPPAKNATGN